MGKLIVMGRDDPEIQKLLEQLDVLSKHTREQETFIFKKLDDLKKKHEELGKKYWAEKKVIWEQIDALVDDKGYLKAIGIDGPAKNTNMTWDEDTMSVKIADRQDEEPELIGGIIIPVD